MSESDDPRKIHALETFSATARCILAKNLEGWEVMTVFAGEIGQSDRFFMVGGAPFFHKAVGVDIQQESISTIDRCICDGTATADLKHSALQLALVLVAGLAQLSPGAYFLRTDLFPAVVEVRPILDVIRRSDNPSIQRRSFSGQILESTLLKRCSCLGYSPTSINLMQHIKIPILLKSNKHNRATFCKRSAGRLISLLRLLSSKGKTWSTRSR